MRSEEQEKIAIKLRELRIAHGYKQVDVASIIDVKQPTYSQYESGARMPGILTLFKLSALYGLTVDDLLRLCFDLDNELYYDSPNPTGAYFETAEYIAFCNKDCYSLLSPDERRLLYIYQKLGDSDKTEVIDFIRFKMERK